MKIRKKLKRLLPYWLSGHGHEHRCRVCDAPYASAVEVRCVACDRGHCPFCVVTVDGETFCEECQPSEAGALPARTTGGGP